MPVRSDDELAQRVGRGVLTLRWADGFVGQLPLLGGQLIGEGGRVHRRSVLAQVVGWSNRMRTSGLFHRDDQTTVNGASAVSAVGGRSSSSSNNHCRAGSRFGSVEEC